MQKFERLIGKYETGRAWKPEKLDKLQQLRRELFILAEEEQKSDRVVQVNLQLFPLSGPLLV